MPASGSPRLTAALGVALCLYTLVEVNYPLLAPQSELALFALLGLVLCFLKVPLHPRWADLGWARGLDVGLALASAVCCSYVIVQTEPAFSAWWVGGQSLGNSAGQETAIDYAMGGLGLLLVLEATRRSIGWSLPLLSLVCLGYALWGDQISGVFAHRGYSVQRTVAQTFLQAQGVFGVSLKVMFTYVFLFVIFGAFLKATGAIGFIIAFARRVFRRSPGGPAKVAVLSSGLMGSLSGSAVANTATTGIFTIPMMRASGFRPETAAGIEAAASTGGALVPPVMGAGAYMMLEIITPPVTFLEIIRAAVLPALLFYLSLFLLVHFFARAIGARGEVEVKGAKAAPEAASTPWQGVVFALAFVSLLAFLFLGFSAFRAVTLSLGVILAASFGHPSTRLGPGKILEALVESARDVIPLVAAASCVGIVIGVVTLTGVGNKFPALILPLAEGNLIAALLVIMACSIVLGMGLPSAVCYLLMATLIGPVLGELGVVPLAAHMFIFYFGMMSMVTPPVALAAYAASSIAGSGIMASSMAAFRFSLVGFTLPFMFVFRPELLMLNPEGGPATIGAILYAFTIAALGALSFSAGLGRFLFRPLGRAGRTAAFAACLLLLYPGREMLPGPVAMPIHDAVGLVVLGGLALVNARAPRASPAPGSG
jgi:TRAP transporter 4TM/12TM fusion protein